MLHEKYYLTKKEILLQTDILLSVISEQRNETARLGGGEIVWIR